MTLPPEIGKLWEEQGGIYAGVLSGSGNKKDYYLIFTEKEFEIVNSDWKSANKAAKNTINGHSDWSLPDKRESMLLSINVPQGFSEEGWYWTATRSKTSSQYAIVQDFSRSYQDIATKSRFHKARPVRRVSVK